MKYKMNNVIYNILLVLLIKMIEITKFNTDKIKS